MSSMSKRCPLITTHVKCARISREPSNSRVRQFLSVVLKKETLVFVLKRSVNPCFHFQTGQGQITPSAMCFTPTLHRLGLKILFCFAVLPRPTSHNHTTDIPPCPPHQHVYKHTTPQHTYRHNAWILQAMVTLHTSILGAREMFETSSCNALFTVFGHRESIIKSFPFFSCTKKKTNNV